jgi:5-methylcytosine-specific restriction protein B
MFSPKVLDRASTIEFRIAYDEMERYFKNARQLQFDVIVSKGKDKAESFMQLANRTMIQIDQKKNKAVFVSFFEILQSMGAEFGYRTANEMSILVGYLTYFGLSENDAYDIAIMQKMLPKLHGSRSKLGRILPALIELCENKYPISFEKLNRMKKSSEENGFASYAEA